MCLPTTLTKIFENAQASGWFEVVYEDSQCTILRIRDQKAQPEPEESDSNDAVTTEPQPETTPQ